jgi:hypothetical protein
MADHGRDAGAGNKTGPPDFSSQREATTHGHQVRSEAWGPPLGSTTIIADPFKVTTRRRRSDEERDFVNEVLSVIAALPLKDPTRTCDGTRWWDVGKGYLVIEHIAQHAGRGGNYWLGALMRAKYEELPMLVIDEAAEDIDAYIKDEHGIAAHSAFLYDVSEQTLWLQRAKGVAGRMMVEDYLRDKSNMFIKLIQVLRQDATKKALSLDMVREIHLGVDPDTDDSFTDVFDQFGNLNAGRIDIRIAPHRGRGLAHAAKAFVRRLTKAVDNEELGLELAKVKGRYDVSDQEDELIDLLNPRGIFATQIPSARSQDPKRLMTAMRSIWLQYKDAV